MLRFSGAAGPTTPVLRHVQTHGQSQTQAKMRYPAPVGFIGCVSRSLPERTRMCYGQGNQVESLLTGVRHLIGRTCVFDECLRLVHPSCVVRVTSVNDRVMGQATTSSPGNGYLWWENVIIQVIKQVQIYHRLSHALPETATYDESLI